MLPCLLIIFEGLGSVAKPDVLLIGEIVANAVEVYETAVALGLTPLVVLLGGQKAWAEYPSLAIEELAEDWRGLPAAVAGTCVYSDLKRERIDRQWRIRLERHVAEAQNQGIVNWTTLVHPSAHVSPSALLGVGVFVGPLVTVASDAEIGEFTRIGRSSSIGHHVTVGSYNHIGPAVVIPGNVILGRGVTVGPAATFLNGKRIGENALVGVGSVVTRDVSSGSQVMGNPARSWLNPVAWTRKKTFAASKWLLRRIGLFDYARDVYRKSRS